MSNHRNKYEKARRRLAAVTFLTNISLDGKFRDTGLIQIADKSLKNNKIDSGVKVVDINKDNDEGLKYSARGRNKGPQSSPIHRVGTDNHSLSSESDYASTITPVKTAVTSGFRERCSSGTTESFKEKHIALRVKKAHLVSLVSTTVDDKSSSESLNFGRFRTSSTCIHENHPLKEVRLIRPSKGVTFRDERLAFVPAQGAPCVIFSTIPYSRTVRSARGDLRKDGVRRRNTSGPRPLSSITDNGVDPFDLLGLQKEENGQDISYSKLLVPSKVCTREQYRKMYDSDFIDKANLKLINRHPHVIAR